MNRIKMSTEQAILAYRRLGWSIRKIAAELCVDKNTVARYIKLDTERSKSDNSTPGSGATDTSKSDNSTPGKQGRRSHCEPFREAILGKLDIGLSAQRIYQDLVSEHGFSGSYQSVKRFVRRLGENTPLPFRRIEREPGLELQIDFGTGAPILKPDGKRKRTHVFRVVLSCSRKGYSEAVPRQTTENFIRCIENAFWYFGGVPRTLVIDNLKAAVKNADWFDPELNPKINSFCRHYGTVILPTRPYTPWHKGKVEKGIEYVKGNALKGRTFNGIHKENEFLLHWEANVADNRIHGTTKKQVRKVFEEVERDALLPLPPDRFPFFSEAERNVHRDGHIEVEKGYYSAPPEYVGRTVWARWDSRLVRIFNSRFEQLIVHMKVEPGEFSTASEHISSRKISVVERGAEYLLKRAELLGAHAGGWAKAMLEARGVRGMRVIQGLLHLARKHSSKEINVACETALECGAFRLKSLRRLLKQKEKQTTLNFIDEHPIIRDMNEYGRFARVSFGEGSAKIVPAIEPVNKKEGGTNDERFTSEHS